MVPGNYGIEFDERQRSGSRTLWLASAGAIALLLLPLLLLRSCGTGKTAADEMTGSRYSEPQAGVEREAPSLKRHFVEYHLSQRGEEGRGRSATPAADQRETTEGRVGAMPKTRSAELKRLLEQSAHLETEDDLEGARQLLLTAMTRPDAIEVHQFIERRLSELATSLLFAPRAMEGKVRHRIAAGDLIGKLARRYGNTEAYIMRANAIERPERLRLGQDIWLLEHPRFELSVKRTGGAVLLLNERFCKRYELFSGSTPLPPGGSYTPGTILAQLPLRVADLTELRLLLPANTTITVE